MTEDPQKNHLHAAGILLFDCSIALLIGLWVLGGLSLGGHLYFRHGADPRRIAIFIGIAGYFFSPSLRERSRFIRGTLKAGELLKSDRIQWVTLSVACSAAVLISIVQCLALRVPMWDVGIFHQILWSLSHGLGFRSTISGAGDFLTDHFSPSLAALVPLFCIAQGSPLFLPVIQCLLIFGGAAAWLFLAQRCSRSDESEFTHDFRNTLAAGTLVFILSFDSLWRNIGWGFHENAVSFFAMSWAFALLFSSTKVEPISTQSQKMGWCNSVPKLVFVFILLLLAAGSKEILLLDVALIFMGWSISNFLSGSRSRYRIRHLVLSCVFLIVAGTLILGFVQFEQVVHPPDKNYFDRYYSYLGNNLSTFLSNLMRSPFLIVKTIGAQELLKYFWIVFSPWLFLPLAVKSRRLWVLTLLPSLASASLATYYALRRPEFHYVLELWPVLACLTVLALREKRSTSWVWAWAFFGLIRMDYDPIGSLREYWPGMTQVSSVREELRKLPESATVMADEMTGTWLAGRKSITRYPDAYFLLEGRPDFLVLKKGTTPLNVKVGGIPVWEGEGWVIYSRMTKYSDNSESVR